MGIDAIIIVALGALAGGFVSGLAGFGTGIASIAIWLYALAPATAATLVVVCSIAAQLQTLPRIWHAIVWRDVLPFVLPGLLGVPIGAALLTSVDVRTFKIGVGCLLIAYSAHAFGFGTRKASAWGGRMADGLVGFFGGVLGGLAGLSGPLPTMWASIRGWVKDQRRAMFQAFNLSVLSAALVSHWASGLITREVAIAVVCALPFTFLGAWLGFSLYARVSETWFSRFIYLLLGVSGAGLLLTNLRM